MTFPAIGRKVEVIILSEVGETGQEQELHGISSRWNLKMQTDKLLYQRATASQTYGSQEETYGSQAGKEDSREKGAGSD